MAWTLASMTIHPASEEFGSHTEANYAIQDILDGAESVISYYGAKSDVIQMSFILDESDNGGTGLATLKAACKAGTTAALVADSGSLGDWKIMSLDARRVQALNQSALVWKCSVDLIEA